MKKAIILFGNIASGKTTLSRLIAQNHPEYERVCLDEIRKKVAPNGEPFTQKLEAQAQEIAMDMLSMHSNVIFETTGQSEFARKALQLIESRFEPVHKFGIWLEYELLRYRLKVRQNTDHDFQHPNPRHLEEYQLKIHPKFQFMPADWIRMDGTQSPSKLYVRHINPIA